MGIKTIACGLSHSGLVLTDGSVYLWGIAGDFRHSKEYFEKCFIRRPTKISFKSGSSTDANNGNVSHRRRSNAQDDSSSVFIDDLKLGE